jgi:hypothetical protein
LEDLIHHSLEDSQTIGETKVHHKWLEEASVCMESGLPLVALSAIDIVVSPVHIELHKIVHALEAMYQVVDQWEWVAARRLDTILKSQMK